MGEVRIRSNVCTDPSAWHLVPGDVIRRFSLSLHGLTQKQKDELMYYAPCSICYRTIFEINEDGCDHPICREQAGMLSPDDAIRRRKLLLDSSESP